MRLGVGLLLICAAVLKSSQLLVEPAATLTNPVGRLLLPLAIGVELGIGLLVFSGLYWRRVRSLAVLLFTVFAGHSLYLVVGGATSCGCFGPIRIHPWWTFLLDVAVVCGLMASARSERTNSSSFDSTTSQPTAFEAGRRQLLAAIASISFATTALLAWHINRSVAIEESGLSQIGDLTILEPEQWLGKPLPVAESIDLDLSTGEWIVVFHRHDCPACREEVPRYEQLGSQGQQVALVEVPPYGASGILESACRHGRLADDREWFVQTPTEIRLTNGLVTDFKIHGH